MHYFDHLYSVDILFFAIGCGILILVYMIRGSELVPRCMLYIMRPIWFVTGIMLVVWTPLHALKYARNWMAFENEVASFKDQECSIRINDKYILDEKAELLEICSKIGEIEHRKSFALKSYQIKIQSSENSMQFNLLEDSRIKDEYWVMLVKTEDSQRRIGTLHSANLTRILNDASK